MFGQDSKFAEIEDVRFYFDAIKTDNSDISGMSRKNGELLALRPHLMKMPNDEFEAVMKAFWGLVNSTLNSSSSTKPQKDKYPSYPDAIKLYEESVASGGGYGNQISPV